MPLSGDLDAPNHEVWTLLGGLAEATKRIRLMPSVISTSRHDARLIANAAATVDHISNGRLELGLGAGGVPEEHERYRLPFPEPAERVARFAEAIEVIKLLWSPGRASFRGRYFELEDAPCEPKPLQQPHPPLVIAGAGEKKSLRLAAQHGSTWRAHSTGTFERFRQKNDLLTEWCRKIGRDPSTLERADSIIPPEDWWNGDVEAGVAQLNAAADAGMTLFVMYSKPPFDLKRIETFTREVIPAFRDSRQAKSAAPAG
jgi:alkanesulfonate monooxygenase SsuD/methylene tetrahydromethanopterin reductase-like flavin-dependent oxidoreductase (luciferase family)